MAHYEYDAWGNQLSSSAPMSGGFAYLFVGALGVRYDSATGLHYMRNRWYDAGLGRFLSRDALGGLNRYEYAYNNPVNWVDVDGLQPRIVNDTAPGGPYWYDMVDGVPTYWNNVPKSLKKKVDHVDYHSDWEWKGWDWKSKKLPDGRSSRFRHGRKRFLHGRCCGNSKPSRNFGWLDPPSMFLFVLDEDR